MSRAWARGALLWLFGLLLLLSSFPAYADGSFVPQGKILEVQGQRVVVDVGLEGGAEPGRILFFYRYYGQVQDQVKGRQLQGVTYVGAAVVESAEASTCVARPTFSLLQVGDLARVASEQVLAVVENASWLPTEAERAYLHDPFLVPRDLNNRIKVLTEAALMGEGDYFYGTTVDFTFWPMIRSGSFTWVESMRFGVGRFSGVTPETDDATAATTEEVGFLFGLAEFDLRLSTYLSLLPQLKLGLNNRGFGVGGGLKARVGSAQNSHMVVGFDLSRAIGGLAFMEYHYFPTRDLQFWLRASYENLPAGNTPGGRVQLGTEFKVNKLLSLTGSFGLGGRRSTDERRRGVTGTLGASFNFWTGRK